MASGAFQILFFLLPVFDFWGPPSGNFCGEEGPTNLLILIQDQQNVGLSPSTTNFKNHSTEVKKQATKSKWFEKLESSWFIIMHTIHLLDFNTLSIKFISSRI